MNPIPKAVFLSYASQDADSARRICDALRAAGIEVWFDQSELVGGDSWDAKIRGQIASCALFVPIISANTQARREGYFRLEWKLAAQRTHMMSERTAFLLPVVIDVTRDADADIPGEFRAVQWTRLISGDVTQAFVARVTSLLAGPAVKTAPAVSAISATSFATPPLSSRLPHWALATLGVLVLALLAYIALRPTTKEVAESTPAQPLTETKPAIAAAAQPPLDFAPAKSIAVLPFANMSPDPENAFFADGVQEDVITHLAKIRDLKVISRTSTLTYRDTTQRNLRRIAGELGVAAVLEGSVRRAGNKVRVTAQLIDARTDAHLWAETYDRELSDVFALQAALAQEIAGALKVTLTPGERAAIGRAMTKNADAYDAYLRAQLLRQTFGPGNSTREQWEEVVDHYRRAVAKDPGFTMAQVQLADVHGIMYRFPHLDSSPARMALAREAMEAAERMAPGSPEASYARGLFAYFVENDWARALVALQRAELALPNESRLTFTLGLTHQRLGRWREERGYFERAFTLDPKSRDAAVIYAGVLFRTRRYLEIMEIARRKETIWAVEGPPLIVARAQFATDGNLSAFRKTLAARLDGRDLELYRDYEAAIDARDFLAALRVISDHDLTQAFKTIDDTSLSYRWSADSHMLGSVRGDAVPSLSRVQMAWLAGEATMARQFARDAIAICTRDRRNPRETSMAFRGVALAEAFAGREAAALSAIEQAIASTNEASDVELARECLGKINVVLGRPEEALAGLREMMIGPCSVSPNEIRADPVWSRLKEDRRFEEILKLAKPL